MNSLPGSSKRFIPTVNDPSKYSAREVEAIIQEAEQVFSDTSIQVYHLPDHAQLVEIITFALAYSGDWYWARVTLPATTNCDNPVLVQQIIKLGASHGIYVCHNHQLLTNLRKKLEGNF